MDAYMVGNLAGRLVLSYLVVWVLMLICSRVDWRRAFKRTHRWYGLGAVLLLFSAGLAASI